MVNTSEQRVLFLSKQDNPFGQRAAEYVRTHFPHSLIFQGNRKEPLPAEVLNWKGDWMISFISSWIYPQTLLDNVKTGAINFHPGSPEYPGTGCTNFAVYNGEKEYGVTSHYMKATVDTGSIIAVKRFPINESDTVYNITQHCYHLLEEMFYEIMECILQSQPLPSSEEIWARKPYTRKQLNELCEIKPGMSAEEIERRIKATTYKHPWAFTKIGNWIFKLEP